MSFERIAEPKKKKSNTEKFRSGISDHSHWFECDSSDIGLSSVLETRSRMLLQEFSKMK